jgi:transcriptional regulator with XRE-family HTH domain
MPESHGHSSYVGRHGERGKYKENWVSDPLRNTILDALNARNMNIADLARAIGAPGSSVVSRWMMGGRPSPESLEAIAESLELDLFDLLYKAEYIKRMPGSTGTDDPAKTRIIQKILNVELTREREAMLHSVLDTMLAQSPKPSHAASLGGL